MKKIINICFNHNNGGLTLDAALIGEVLEKAGYIVWYNLSPMNELIQPDNEILVNVKF